MSNKQETLQEKMERLGYAGKTQSPRKEKKQNGKLKKIKNNKSKKKKISKKIVAIVVALCIVASTAITGIVLHFTKKKNTNTNTGKNDIGISAVGDLGTELDFPEENTTSKYGETTGKVDVNKIEEKNDKIYVDKESADKSNQVGTSSVDTKGDTLKVEPDGTVKEKEEGYEVKDKETGSIIQSGNVNSDGSIDGFKKDEDLGGYFEEEDDVETLVYSDANYYDSNGDLVLAKGDLVEEERLAYAKKHYSTTKPAVSSQTSTSSTVTSTPSVSSNTSSTPSTSSNTSSTDEGKVNADGTYTIFGLTFETKADYEQWVLQGYEGYAEADGIMKSEEEIQKQMQKVK